MCICVYAYNYICIYVIYVYAYNLYSSVEETHLSINYYQSSLSNNISLIFINSPGFV